MFTTFTDWEFTDIGAMEETGSNMWPKMQAVGALSFKACLLYTSPSPRDVEESRMPSSA